jgi:hypothetical protein
MLTGRRAGKLSGAREPVPRFTPVKRSIYLPCVTAVGDFSKLELNHPACDSPPARIPGSSSAGCHARRFFLPIAILSRLETLRACGGRCFQQLPAIV